VLLQEAPLEALLLILIPMPLLPEALLVRRQEVQLQLARLQEEVLAPLHLLGLPLLQAVFLLNLLLLQVPQLLLVSVD
jgi:hypothetical protein